MNKLNLALLGGVKTIKTPFKVYNSIGQEEANAAIGVIQSGVLSKFIGAWCPDFYGGNKVRELEAEWASYFGVKHAITVNSWTSGLVAAVGAIGIEPGDEVIVPTWTMSATATAILAWNGIPVFADIDEKTFNIDPISVEKNITENTKAIIAVDIFGQSADMNALSSIAKKHHLRLISDSAQSPGALYKGRYAGTLADIGGYSLNYHKHIHTGEGGVLVTNNDLLAEKLRMIRNHAEVVIDGRGDMSLVNMIGYNFRLGEIECAIGLEQLKKLKSKVESRQYLADKLTNGLKDLAGLTLPRVESGSTHAYYIYPLLIDEDILGVGRNLLCKALRAEGVDIIERYQNIHLLPIYQNKIAYGSKGFPWTSEVCKRDVDYQKGICPTAERLNDSAFIGLGLCSYDYTYEDIDLIIMSFRKVWSGLSDLKNYKHQ